MVTWRRAVLEHAFSDNVNVFMYSSISHEHLLDVDSCYTLPRLKIIFLFSVCAFLTPEQKKSLGRHGILVLSNIYTLLWWSRKVSCSTIRYIANAMDMEILQSMCSTSQFAALCCCLFLALAFVVVVIMHNCVGPAHFCQSFVEPVELSVWGARMKSLHNVEFLTVPSRYMHFR